MHMQVTRLTGVMVRTQPPHSLRVTWYTPSTTCTCTRRVAAPRPHLTARSCAATPWSGVQSPLAGAVLAWEQLEGQ